MGSGCAAGLGPLRERARRLTSRFEGEASFEEAALLQPLPLPLGDGFVGDGLRAYPPAAAPRGGGGGRAAA